MSILVCRRCHSEGRVENINHYRKKNIARIVCNNCGKIWYIPTPPNWNETDIIRAYKEQLTFKGKTDDGISNMPDTAMANAFAKAFAKKSDKGES